MSSATVSSTTPDFDRLAHVYRWMEWASFGPWLQLCRCTYLPAVTGHRRALILGDGDGRFSARLLRTNPQIQIDTVDASSAMLKELVNRAGLDAARVRTQCADIRNWQPANHGYDLIVSHFFLDCLATEEVEHLAEKLHRAASPSALWVISEFAVPENAYGRLLARPLVLGLYWTFGLLTGLDPRRLPDHRTVLRNFGFELREHRQYLGGLLVSELWGNPEA